MGPRAGGPAHHSLLQQLVQQPASSTRSGSGRLMLQKRHPQNSSGLLVVAPVALCQGAGAAQIPPDRLEQNLRAGHPGISLCSTSASARRPCQGPVIREQFLGGSLNLRKIDAGDKREILSLACPCTEILQQFRRRLARACPAQGMTLPRDNARACKPLAQHELNHHMADLVNGDHGFDFRAGANPFRESAPAVETNDFVDAPLDARGMKHRTGRNSGNRHYCAAASFGCSPSPRRGFELMIPRRSPARRLQNRFPFGCPTVSTNCKKNVKSDTHPADPHNRIPVLV